MLVYIKDAVFAESLSQQLPSAVVCETEKDLFEQLSADTPAVVLDSGWENLSLLLRKVREQAPETEMVAAVFEPLVDSRSFNSVLVTSMGPQMFAVLLQTALQ